MWVQDHVLLHRLVRQGIAQSPPKRTRSEHTCKIEVDAGVHLAGPAQGPTLVPKSCRVFDLTQGVQVMHKSSGSILHAAATLVLAGVWCVLQSTGPVLSVRLVWSACGAMALRGVLQPMATHPLDRQNLAQYHGSLRLFTPRWHRTRQQPSTQGVRSCVHASSTCGRVSGAHAGGWARR